MEINSLSQWWTQFMIAVLWQSVLLALLAATACWMLSKASASVRFWIWELVAIKLLLIPFWTLVLPTPNWFFWPSSMARSDEVLTAGAEPPTVDEDKEQRRGTSRLGTNPTLRADEPREVPADLSNQIAAEVNREQPPIIATPSEPNADLPDQAAAPFASAGQGLLPTLFLAWSLLVAYQFWRLIGIRARLRSLLNAAEEVSGGKIFEVVHSHSAKLKIKAPRVLLSDQPSSPFVCGIARPTLVLPVVLTEKLSQKQLAQVVCHELAHLRRGDLWWNWIHELARIFYFFHPAIYWINSRIHLERELSCDQLAIRCCDSSAQQYALTLVDVLSHVWQPAGMSDTPESKPNQAECSSL